MFKMLYKFPKLLASVILLVSCGTSKKATVTESDIKLPGSFLPAVVIDGKPDEWVRVPMDMSPRSTLQLSMANNNNNLFVLLRIPGQIEQLKLLQGGMDIWVDFQNQKNKKTGISYPVKGELPEPDQQQQIASGKPDIKLQRLQVAGQLISLNRFGFKDEFNGVQSIRQNTGFKAAINWDENDVLIYELTIPLNAFKENVMNGSVAIGFNIHGIDRPKSQHAENSSYNENGGMGRSGGGHRAGGNFGSGHRGDLRSATTAYNQREKLFIPETFWAIYSISHP